jgi:hypothetical protein
MRQMEPISIEDLALLEVLKRIDAGELNASDSQVMPRLLEDGLVTEAPHGAALTLAGIELCKSLQHRVAADAQGTTPAAAKRRSRPESGRLSRSFAEPPIAAKARSCGPSRRPIRVRS